MSELKVNKIKGSAVPENGPDLTIDDDGNFNFDSGTLFVDSVNNRVGVNTSTPQNTLDVNGGLKVSSKLQIPSWTTETRPSSPTAGTIGFNSSADIATVEVWTGEAWARAGQSGFAAGGGNIIEQYGVYNIHTFTSSSVFSVNGTGTVDILLVGGGGGGGAAAGNCSNGGGGSGGLVYKTGHPVTTGNYSIVVGLGGNGAPGGTAISGTNGTSSTAFGYTALGGGAGGGGGGYNSGSGVPGGSGGGGAHPYSGSVGSGTQPSQSNPGALQYGNPGGAGNNGAPEWGGGGGGGSGGAGEAGSAPTGGYGGIGREYSILGPNLYYAAGGAGANCGNPNCNRRMGGRGGGGPAWCGVGVQGADGLGSGGGGGGYGNPGRHPTAPPGPNSGGRGGNGIVVVRYAGMTADPTIGQTSTNPATNASQILAHNASASNGLYWIKPSNYGGAAQQIYCDMSNGGWMLVAANNASNTVIPGGTSRNNAAYYLNRIGSLGNPDPNSDYIIGSIIDSLIFQNVKVFAWGRGSTNGSTSWPSNLGTYIDCQWPIGMGLTGSSRLLYIAHRDVVTITGNSSLSSSATYFTLDGVQQDAQFGGLNSNSNQSTVGGVGTQDVSGDPAQGCYLGHGSNEGSFEGWYDNTNNSADCQGYTTWVK